VTPEIEIDLGETGQPLGGSAVILIPVPVPRPRYLLDSAIDIVPSPPSLVLGTQIARAQRAAGRIAWARGALGRIYQDQVC